MTARRLYELTTEDGCSISPYVWRTKFALGHKKLPYESRAVGFTDILTIGPGTFKSVPILEDGGNWIGDSWAIASYLDRAYPGAPPLFSSHVDYGTTRFFERWLTVEVVSKLFRICVLDIYNRLPEKDRAYFRQSREARLALPLEAAHCQREQYLPELRERLQPLRLTLREQSFIGGDSPSYADYVAAGAFIWAGSVATVELLEANDPLVPWLRRCLDLHDRIGASLSLPGLPAPSDQNGVSR